VFDSRVSFFMISGLSNTISGSPGRVASSILMHARELKQPLYGNGRLIVGSHKNAVAAWVEVPGLLESSRREKS
jgi:hypothetical protein